MEKGDGPPPYNNPEMLAPTHPGPPLGSSVMPQPAAPQYQQTAPQPNVQPVQQTVVQQNQATQPAVVVVQARPTEAPGNMLCPHCKTTVVTTTEYKLGMLTWIIAGVLFIIGCWPCCLIPFFVGTCKDVQHSCPQCNNVLHVYRRM